MVLSVGYGARVQDALAWQGINNLTYPVLSDYPGYPVGVTLQYTNFLGNPTLPWDAILTTDQVVSFTGDSYAGGQWQIEEIEAIFDSLFDPQIAADPDTLDFGLVGQLPVQLVLVLDNAGTGLLNIQQISSSSPYFSPNITQDSIFAVDDSLLLTVTFDAPGFGEFNGVLTVAATQDTLEIPLSAVVPNAVEPTPSLPRQFAVQCFPNPFNAELTLQINLQKPQAVQVEIFSVTGERQILLFDGPMGVGDHQLRWSDESVPSGIYLVQITGDDWKEVRKVVLLR